jgi:dienelactone hydrolase
VSSHTPAITRRDVIFDGEGVKLFGWLYRPESPANARCPAIVLSHGFSALLDMDLDNYARVFAAAGFICLAYEHRNWGRSAGWPRHETHPWMQVEDMRAAISFLRTQPGVDPERIGLWGTSYSGGHAITVAALDRRVRCVVSQVPLVSGARTFDNWVPADRSDKFMARLAADRDARARGEPAGLTKAALPGSETEEWARASDVAGVYPNALTLRSLELLRTYEPISFIARIAPTPLLMIVADQDVQTPVAWQREAFELAGAPKQLVSLPGRHYDPYMSLFGASSQAARDWFLAHLSHAADAA